jgi:hypothetical protein
MDFEELYKTTLKMLNDKFNINQYLKEDFLIIYKTFYQENQKPTNELNKEILKKINQIFSQPIKTDIDIRVKELENVRNNIDKLTTINPPSLQNQPISSIIAKEDMKIPQIQITNEDKKITYKTFIINTIKNNFKITLTIDIKLNTIYPCCLCLPSNIKNQTPYIILSINDGIKNNNYTYIPFFQNKWDIWKPITENYNEINLNNNKWIINIYDYLNNVIDFDEYYSTIFNVIYDKNEEMYFLKIDNLHLFNKNDKIKLILKDGSSRDNKIYNIINDKIVIYPENLEYNDFIDAKIFNYNYQFSLLFKYYIK